MMRSCSICSELFVPSDEHQHACSAPTCRKTARTFRNFKTKQRRRAALERQLARAQEVRP